MSETVEGGSVDGGSVYEKNGSTHPLNNSSTHLLKNKIAVKTIKNIKWENE